jgi:hypothetical protein
MKEIAEFGQDGFGDGFWTEGFKVLIEERENTMTSCG